jgi:gamma-butyrobetaine dioxygenase
VIWDELLSIYGKHGSASYFGEPVTVTEHGLQAAHYARVSNASNSLIVAALLHDVGHLINSAPEDLAEWHSDDRHEETGSRWLALHFGPEVSEPVRLHVLAKRYLCTTEPAYFRTLSAASVVTLRLQGGPMTPADVDAFEAEPYFRDAVRLRRWDEQAKIAGLSMAGFASYQPLIERLTAAPKPKT